MKDKIAEASEPGLFTTRMISSEAQPRSVA